MSGNIATDQATDHEGDPPHFFFDIHFEKVRHFSCTCSTAEGFKSSRNAKAASHPCHQSEHQCYGSTGNRPVPGLADELDEG